MFVSIGWYDLWIDEIARARKAFASWIEAQVHEVAIAPSISVALSSIASALDCSTCKKSGLEQYRFSNVIGAVAKILGQKKEGLSKLIDNLLLRRKVMQCHNCRVENREREKYCRECGTDLRTSSKSLVIQQAKLPAVLYRSSVPRSVAAGVGALALGMGIELLRRNVLSHLRMRWVKKPSLSALALNGVKDMMFSQPDKSVKLPKGYELHETVVYMSRVVRRKD